MKRLLALLLCIGLLAGCSGMQWLPQVSEEQEAVAPVQSQPDTEQEEIILPVYLADGVSQPESLAAYAESRGITLQVVSRPEDAGLQIQMQQPESGCADLTEDPVLVAAIRQMGFSAAAGRQTLPMTLSRYGYQADTRMLDELFGGQLNVEDLQKASYEEWSALIEALDSWVKEPGAAQVTLNGTEYTLAEESGEYTDQLTGVFAIDCVDGFGAAPLTAVFAASGGKVSAEALTGPLNSVWETFRLETDYLAGEEGSPTRGEDDLTGMNAAQAAQLFGEGKAIFWRASQAEAEQELAPEKSGTLAIIPMKFSFTPEDITSDTTVETLASTPVLASVGWLSVPEQADQQAAEQGEGYILWLYSSTEGQQYLYGDSAGTNAIFTDGISAQEQRAVNDALVQLLDVTEWTTEERDTYVQAALAAVAEEPTGEQQTEETPEETEDEQSSEPEQG